MALGGCGGPAVATPSSTGSVATSSPSVSTSIVTPAPTGTPAVTASSPPKPSPAETPAASSAAASPVPSPTDPTAAQGAGVTLHGSDSGQANLKGGRYRVGWSAPGCTTLRLWWQGAGLVEIPVTLPSGQAFVDLPAGVGSLNRAADCDYIVRFEAAT